MERKEGYVVNGIDMSNLARLMLNWEQWRRQLDELEEAIKDTVLQLGATQTVGGVRATYSNPRNSYDYETPGHLAPRNVIEANSKVVVDWRAVCKMADMEPIVTEGDGPGSVSIKLLG